MGGRTVCTRYYLTPLLGSVKPKTTNHLELAACLCVHRQALRQANKDITERLGFKKIDMELVNSAVVNIIIDGYTVSNPLALRRNVEMIALYFAPLIHLSAMRTIAKRLELDFHRFVAEPYAVALSFTDESYEFGSLVIDIGGGK